MRVVFAALVLSLVACSSSSKDDPGGPCAIRKGTYVVRATVRDGDCEPPTEQVLNLEQDPATVGKEVPAPEGCSGHITTSADNCKTDTEQDCPLTGIDGSTSFSSAVTWSKDGASGSGVIGFRSYRGDGSLYCSSSLDVTYERR